MSAFPRLLALALLLAGCDAPDAGALDSAALENIAVAPQPGHCRTQIFEGDSFTVCPFDAARDELRLALEGADGLPLRSLPALHESLGKQADRVRFAMNAGMYDEEGRPVGLFVADGKEHKPLNLRTGPGNFHLLPNGVFAVDGKGAVSVQTSQAYATRISPAAWATQSGPMLVIDGKLHPKFDENGPSQLVRNGVGVKDPSTAFFVISEAGVSFGRFARFFRDALGCPNALFLDGSVSSLWDPKAERQDTYPNLGPMVVVLEKE